MVFQTMIVDVREICDKGVYYGTVGEQYRNSPYNWIDFAFPEHHPVTLEGISCNGGQLNDIDDSRLMVDFDMTLSIGGKKVSYKIVKSEVEDGIIVNYIQFYKHHFIGFDEKEVEKRFIKEVKRTLKGTWGGINNVSKSSALKNYLMTSDKVKYFEENYPELLI